MKDIHDQTYYELLEIDPSATQDEILKAYNRARATYGHNSPALYSLFNREEAQELLRLIDEAYAVLSNQFKRRQYDSHSKVSSDHGRNFSQPSGDPTQAQPHPQKKSEDADPAFAIPSAGDLAAFNDMPEPGPASAPGPRSSPTHQTPPPAKRQDLWDSPATGNSVPTSGQGMGAPGAAPSGRPAGVTPFGTYKMDPSFEDEIKKTEVFSGKVLQKIRLYKNITIDQISESTKISRSYLVTLEADTFTSLPAPVFVRGFIVQVAKILGLDPAKTANSFIKLLKESQKK